MPVSKTKNNKYKSKKTSWLQRNKRLALFIATFAVVGGFFLWRSFAGTALSISMDACANGKGYYIAQIDGTVTAFGAAKKDIGSPKSDNTKLYQGVVDIASTPDCQGYWVMTGAGRVMAYGNASFKGQITEDAPDGFYVAIIPTSSGQGYWIVNRSGGVVAKGDAEGKVNFGKTNYQNALGTIAGVNEIVDADAAKDNGLYLLDKNGKVYTVGDAERRDDVTLRTGEIATSISAYNMNRSYYVATSKGKVFAYGSGAKLKGDRDGTSLNGGIVSLVYRGTPGTDDVGYWMLDGGGKIYAHNVTHYGGTGDVDPVVYIPPTCAKNAPSKPLGTWPNCYAKPSNPGGGGTGGGSNSGGDPCTKDLKDVLTLQKCLNAKGANPKLDEDGIPGQKTRAACQQIFKNYCPYPPLASGSGSGMVTGGGSGSGSNEGSLNQCERNARDAEANYNLAVARKQVLKTAAISIGAYDRNRDTFESTSTTDSLQFKLDRMSYYISELRATVEDFPFCQGDGLARSSRDYGYFVYHLDNFNVIYRNLSGILYRQASTNNMGS